MVLEGAGEERIAKRWGKKEGRGEEEEEDSAVLGMDWDWDRGTRGSRSNGWMRDQN